MTAEAKQQPARALPTQGPGTPGINQPIMVFPRARQLMFCQLCVAGQIAIATGSCRCCGSDAPETILVAFFLEKFKRTPNAKMVCAECLTEGASYWPEAWADGQHEIPPALIYFSSTHRYAPAQGDRPAQEALWEMAICRAHLVQALDFVRDHLAAIDAQE